jgi:hypothetical protein
MRDYANKEKGAASKISMQVPSLNLQSSLVRWNTVHPISVTDPKMETIHSLLFYRHNLIHVLDI